MKRSCCWIGKQALGILLLLATLWLQGCGNDSAVSQENDFKLQSEETAASQNDQIDIESSKTVQNSLEQVSDMDQSSSKANIKTNSRTTSSRQQTLSSAESKLTVTSSEASAQNHKKSMEILFIGDSNVEVGNITTPIKDKLDAEYGYTGSGYTSLNEDFFTPKRNGVRVVNDIHCMKYDMVTYQKRLSPPFDAAQGLWVSSDTKDAVTIADFRGTSVDIYYLAQPNGGSFAIEIDNKQREIVNTSATSRCSKKVTIDGLSEQELHRMRLIVKEGSVSLQGFDAKNNAVRGVIHSWGNSSAATKDFLAVEESVMRTGLTELNPSIVVLMIGTNDHVVDRLPAEHFKNNLITLISRVKQALPESKILVCSTVQTDTPEAKTLLKEYVASAFPEAAQETGCAYFDLSSFFGSYRKSLMMDAYHPNEAGGEKIADELWNQIQKLK